MWFSQKATEFGEKTQDNGHYAVQGHSMSPILVPSESPYATVFYILSLAVSKLLQIIGQMSAFDVGGVPVFNTLVRVER